jgi:selenide,water dikinase
MDFVESPAAALLFDPQTAGGLLAAVPKDNADEVLAALREAGETAAKIGIVTEGYPFLTVTD